MHQRHLARLFAVVVLGLVVSQWALTAQTPAGQKPAVQKTTAQKPAALAPAAQTPTEKRPLSYDVVDYWRSIQGTRLSNDGQWLAYALTSQAEDGELVVRNLQDGPGVQAPARHRAARSRPTTRSSSSPSRRARPTRRRNARPTSGSEAARPPDRARGVRAPRRQAPREPRTGLGIMTLPDGKVTTVEKVGSFRMAAESATWLAYYKGVGGAGGGGGGARRRGRARGRRRGAGGRRTAGLRRRRRPGRAARRPRRHRARSARTPVPTSILRKLATGEEIDDPRGHRVHHRHQGRLARLRHLVDRRREGRRLRCGASPTASVKTLMTGRGHYKSLTFDEAGQQIAFLSDQAEYDKPVSPYRLYLWKGGDAPADRTGVRRHLPDVLKGWSSPTRRPRFSRRRLDDLP